MFLKEVDDNELPGHPNTSKTYENIKNVNNIVRNYRHLSIGMIPNMVNTDKETVQQILNDK